MGTKITSRIVGAPDRLTRAQRCQKGGRIAADKKRWRFFLLFFLLSEIRKILGKKKTPPDQKVGMPRAVSLGRAEAGSL